MTVPFFSVPELEGPGVVHGFFTRQGGVGKGVFKSLNCAYKEDQPREETEENLRRVRETVGYPQGVVCGLNQVHGDQVVTVTQDWDAQHIQQADALVTKERGFLLSILTADCVPILFLDLQNRVVGAAHAGWRSAYAGIVSHTVTAMERIGAHRHTIRAAIGPCIHQESYEVSQEFKDDFLNQSADYAKYFKPSDKPHHFLFHLPLFVYDRLQAEGLGNISWVQEDTYTQPDLFFSCRRAAHQGFKKFGNQISIIGLKE